MKLLSELVAGDTTSQEPSTSRHGRANSSQGFGEILIQLDMLSPVILSLGSAEEKNDVAMPTRASRSPGGQAQELVEG